MQAVIPRISVAPAVGSVVQRVAHIAAPVLAAGAGAAIVFHQRRSSVSPSSVTLPRRGPRGRRMQQQLTVVNVVVEPKGPIAPRWHLKSEEEEGVQISPLSAAASTSSLLSGELLGGLSHTMPMLPKRRRRSLPSATRASSKDDVLYSHPAMTKKKPKWWWRTLACLPYLNVLLNSMVYSELPYHLHPFLRAFKFSTYSYWMSLPYWFPMAYFVIAYNGVVERKEWPRFFRFHVIIGIYLDLVLGIITLVMMPLAVYSGKVNMHFWTAIAFAYFFTVLESMRRALAGMYPYFPFISDFASKTLDKYDDSEFWE